MSGKGRSRKLQLTVAILQNRFGTRAIRRATGADASLHPALPTGFPALDRALGIGGLPKGHITELLGVGTAGQATLAAKTLAQAQRQGQHVLYVDTHHDVDLDFLVRCGVRLDTLIVLRPSTFAQALLMTGDFLREGGADAIVWDRILPQLQAPNAFARLDAALRQWNLWLSRSLCTLLFLTELPAPQTYPAGLSLPSFASLRLLFRRREWLRQRQRITGFVSEVSILKNRFGPSGPSALIRVRFTNGIHAEDV